MFERYQDPRETLLHKLEAGVERETIFGPLNLDKENRRVSIGENQESLTPFEYQILWILVRAQGGKVSVEEIESFLYEEKSKDRDLPLTNGVEVYIHRLRKKLEALGGESVRIATFRGHNSYSLELGPVGENS